MQTLLVSVCDDYLENFMDYVDEHREHIAIVQKIAFDLHYEKRKKDLQEIIEASENGTMELLSQEQYEHEMKIFFKDLQTHANI